MLIFMLINFVLGYKTSEIKDRIEFYEDDALFGKYAVLKLSGDYKNNQAIYSVSVMLGNPTEEFDLLLDISSYYTWVEQKHCKACYGFQHQYAPEDSLTFFNLSTIANGESLYRCTYFGYLVSDFLTLYSDTRAISARIPFGMASVDHMCNKNNFDGGLGLAPPINFMPTPIIDYFNTSGEITQSVFAIYLNNFTSKSGYFTPPSSLMFANFNISIYSSNPESVFYVPIVKNSNRWQVVFDELIVGSWLSPLNVSVRISNTITKMQGDIDALMSFAQYYINLGLVCNVVPYTFVFSCLTDNPNTLPDLKFYYKNSNIIFPSSEIWECKKTNCTMNINFNDAGFWVFGQSFLQNYFTIFNYDNQSIGFAPALTADFHEKPHSNSLYLVLYLIISIIV